MWDRLMTNLQEGNIIFCLGTGKFPDSYKGRSTSTSNNYFVLYNLIVITL